VWASITFGSFVATLAFQNYIESESLRLVAGYVSVFLVVLIAVGMINLIIGVLVDKTGLSSTDRVLGMVFGGGRGAVIVAVLVVLAGTTAMPRETWWRSSNLIPYFEVLGGELRKLLPAEFGDRWRGV
jgi:membrane protein required for colicin V production